MQDPLLMRVYPSDAGVGALNEPKKGRPKLHAGFGVLSQAQEDHPPFRWLTASFLVVIVSAFITGYLLYLIHVAGADGYGIPSPWNETKFFLQFKEHMNPDQNLRITAASHLAILPLFFGVINHLVAHMRRTTFWWDASFISSTPKEPSRSSCCTCIDPLAGPPFLLATIWNLRCFCSVFFKDPLGGHLSEFCKVILALVALMIYNELLDRVEGKLGALKKSSFETLEKNQSIQKNQLLVEQLVQRGSESDYMQTFSAARTVAAEILQYAWWPYYITAKILGILFAIAVFMGVTLPLVAVVSVLTALAFIFDLGPNLLSLLRLALFNPFYVGDIVALNLEGTQGTPENSIVGFVENITISFVVIRNFEMKQTWIPHKKFSEFIIQNWTRRPTKTVLLNFGISCECSYAKVEQLAAFGKKWIKQSPDILNGGETSNKPNAGESVKRRQGYTKCHITNTGNGYNIEVIFFPDIGVSHRDVRQKFILAFMGAAEKLKIPFVPLNIQQNFCKTDAAWYNPQLDDLQEFLPDRDAPLPRKNTL